MKTKQVLASILLLFIVIQLNGQVSVGVKTIVRYSKLTHQSSISLLFKKIDTPDSVISGFDTERSEGIAGVIQYELYDFLSIGIEPGFTRADDFIIAVSNIPTSQGGVFEKRYIYLFEAPIKMQLRFPLFKDRIGIYTDFGINLTQYMFGIDTSSIFLDIERFDRILKGWKVKNTIGFGTDVKFGRNRIFLDCDFASPLGTKPFATGAASEEFIFNFNLKEFQLGIGYVRGF